LHGPGKNLYRLDYLRDCLSIRTVESAESTGSIEKQSQSPMRF